MSVRQPDALSASLRKHVCSPEDKWNFARMWVLHPPARAKESQTEQQAPSIFASSPFPPPSPKVQAALLKAFWRSKPWSTTEQVWDTRDRNNTSIYETLVTGLCSFHYE